MIDHQRDQKVASMISGIGRNLDDPHMRIDKLQFNFRWKQRSENLLCKFVCEEKTVSTTTITFDISILEKKFFQGLLNNEVEPFQIQRCFRKSLEKF